eukprot:TRINITY_DN3244_c4_g1_i1.p2 TRINITY_DN3244_c4_g1~~TRINITY_DN3244_c4_g1_i1.p2  ORF type:complete len:104 (+),score=4.62 TRINITY_DN3244_c4_g1_i1:538-849(+)
MGLCQIKLLWNNTNNMHAYSAYKSGGAVWPVRRYDPDEDKFLLITKKNNQYLKNQNVNYMILVMYYKINTQIYTINFSTEPTLESSPRFNDSICAKLFDMSVN